MKAALRVFACLVALVGVHQFAMADDAGIDLVAPVKNDANSPTGVVRAIAKHLRDGRTKEALALMTKEAADEFVGEYLLMAVDIGYTDDSEEMEKVWLEFNRKLRAINTKYGLRKDVFPAAYYDETEWDSDDYFLWIDTAIEKLLAVVDKKNQRIAVTQEIHTLLSTLTEKQQSEVIYNPLGGKIVNEEVNGLSASITLETADDPAFLLVTNMNGTWLWNGYDEAKEDQWLNEPHALVPEIKLVGTTLSGKKFKLADLKGKVVLIDFWGTWCDPCIAELPAMKKIYAALHDKGFEIIGVAADDQYTLGDFLKKNKLPWENIADEDDELFDKFNISAVPTVFLCNQKGEHYRSDLFGVELFDEVIKQLKLDPKEFRKVRAELVVDEYGFFTIGGDGPANEVGFPFADRNRDDQLSAKELRKYIENRLNDDSLPHRKIFIRLDADMSGAISSAEFENRHDAIRHFMGEDYFDEGLDDDLFEEPDDPGVGYVPFRGLNQPVDDRKTMGALYHRYFELVDADHDDWKNVKLDQVPEVATDKAYDELKASQKKKLKKTPATVSDLVNATVMIAGGGDDFFTAGGVVVSDSGLTLTNYHVAEAMKDSKLAAMDSGGKTHRVMKFIAGNAERDIALIQLEGTGFRPIGIASTTPDVGDDLVMMHHSESRFYTYDRGYVMRHPTIGEDAWLEVSMDYAPGASGCGIFNKQLQLVGLVSTIQYGYGPDLAEPFDLTADIDGWQGDDLDELEEFEDEPLLLVKHAVSLKSIYWLFAGDPPPAPIGYSLPKVGRVFEKSGLKLTPVLSSAKPQPGDEITLTLKLDIPAGHHIYAADNKLLPTKVTFTASKQFTPIGKPKFSPSIEKKSPTGDSKILTGKTTVQQKFRLSPDGTGEIELAGILRFGLCNGEVCFPPEDLKFSILTDRVNSP